MSQAALATFPHRRNRDGTFDSICPRCFVTVSSKYTEVELQEAESSHNCQGFELAQMWRRTDQQGRTNRARPAPRIDSRKG